MSRAMCLVLKIALAYLYLLSGIALHGSCSSTCQCPETCSSSDDDQPAIPCLSGADHASLIANRQANEAVCSDYEVLTDPITQDLYCDFTGTHDSINDMCQTGGSLCIVQNPNQKTQSCQKDHHYCNYLLECPPNQILWVQCTAMDIPHFDDNDECMDEVTLLSPFIPNGEQSVCGSSCYTIPVISPSSIEVNYGASHCCHNYGFSLSSFCSALPSKKKKREITTDSCLKERIIVVPMEGTLEYSNRTIRVTIPSKRNILTYKDIELLFLEDKRRGNSIYTDTGLSPLRGYGELEIVGYVAYYRYSTIEPSLMPNVEEYEYITKSVIMLTDIVRETTYNDFVSNVSESAVNYDMVQLRKAQQEAELNQFSSNPFVRGISKDLLTAVDPLLTT